MKTQQGKTTRKDVGWTYIKWLKLKRVTEALKEMRDRDAWKVMIERYMTD